MPVGLRTHCLDLLIGCRRILAQLGKKVIDEGGNVLFVQVRLPGTAVPDDQSPVQAADKMLSRKLPSISQHVNFEFGGSARNSGSPGGRISGIFTETEVRLEQSRYFGIGTRLE